MMLKQSRISSILFLKYPKSESCKQFFLKAAIYRQPWTVMHTLFTQSSYYYEVGLPYYYTIYTLISTKLARIVMEACVYSHVKRITPVACVMKWQFNMGVTHSTRTYTACNQCAGCDATFLKLPIYYWSKYSFRLIHVMQLNLWFFSFFLLK